MRILLVTREYPPHIKGGMCCIVEQMVKQHQRFGVELTVIANRPGKGTRRERINGVPFYRVPSLGSTFLTQLPTFGFYASRLVNKIQHRFDAVYSNFSPIFCQIRRPFIAGFHATRYGESIGCMENGRHLYAILNRLYIPFDRHLIEKADGVIVLCEKMVGEITATAERPRVLTTITTGVDTQSFKPLAPRRFDGKEKRILYVGRLDARKGIDVLIHAFRQVQKSVKAKLIIVGEGSERSRLIRLANTLEVPVDFVGHIPHPRLVIVYNEADLFVSPSLYEGSAITLVILEAMACATPVIVSDAFPDFGVPRFRRGSVESLTKVLSEYISSEEKLVKLSKVALEMSHDYNWDRIVEKTFTFIRQFVK